MGNYPDSPDLIQTTMPWLEDRALDVRQSTVRRWRTFCADFKGAQKARLRRTFRSTDATGAGGPGERLL